MHATHRTVAGREAGHAAAKVKVWDPFVRLFHWTLAACIFGAFLVEEGDAAHRWLGYMALGLVATRLVWGVIGSRHARFSGFVHGPRAVVVYLRERLAGTSQRRLGHNPAAAVMIVLLLAMVAAVGVSGWLLTTEALFGSEWLEALHGVLAWTLSGMIGVHVAAVVVESLHDRENLIAAMFHGRKRAVRQGDDRGD